MRHLEADMNTLNRYARIYGKLLKYDIMYFLTFRTNFLICLFVELIYFFAFLTFYRVIFQNVKTIAGWTYDEIMFLYGFDMIMSEFAVGFVFANNTNTIPRKINTGEVDFALLKPLNSLFTLTFSSTYFPSIVSMIPGLYLMIISFQKLHIPFNMVNIISGFYLLICGMVIVYSIMTIIASFSFLTQNGELFPRLGMNSITNFSSYPHDLFKGFLLRMVFFFVLPTALVSSIPSKALLSGVSPSILIYSGCIAVLFFTSTTIIWRTIINNYTSASS